MNVEAVNPAGSPDEKKPLESGSEKPFDPSSVLSGGGDSTYIDMGELYGNYIVTQCMVWWPEPVHIDQDKADAILKSIFDKLKASGTDTIDLSFAQISDIQDLLNGKGGSATDTIAQIFKDNYPVGSTGENFLKYMISYAHENGMKVDLSLGGANATSDDMKIPGDPTTEADNLAKFLEEYDFDSVDFDIEGSGANSLMTANTPANVVAFFKELHSQLSSQSPPIPSILTVAGSIQDGPEGTLKDLFTDFSSMFDGVNLMLYSNSQYYLDANNTTWGISQWLAATDIPPDEIHIGFYDSINYNDPSSNAGNTPYNIPQGLSNGAAAAYIYIQLEKQLKEINPDYVPLGQPFFWTDQPTDIPSDNFMEDFNNYLQQNEAKALR